MYHLSKLKKPSVSFVTSAVATGSSKGVNFSAAVAYVLTRMCGLPATEKEELELFYRNTYLGHIQKALGELNEVCPLNIDLIKQIAFGFYRQRYIVNFPAIRPLCVRQEQGVFDLFGLTASFSKEVLDEINLNPIVFMTNVSALTDIFTELEYTKQWHETEEKDVNFAP